MIPGFTADAALGGRLASSGRRSALDAAGSVMAQQREDPSGGPLKALPTFPCPGCTTHSCGFLGLSTCLTCC